MTDLVETILAGRPLPQSQWHVRRNIIFPPGGNYIYEKTLKDPANVNNCIEYYLFLGSLVDSVLRAKLLLFAQMTDEPAFDQLRSKEQLGYVVWSGARYSATTLGYRVIIQSERTAAYLESRIDAFLSRFADTLENMTEDEFEGHKRSIINKRLEKLKNLASETNRYWSHIGSEYFDFLQNEVDAARVRGLSKQEMVEFYRQYIDPQSPTRAKVSIHLNAQAGEAAKNADPQELKSKFISLLGAQLEAAGFTADPEKLQAAFAEIDLSAGNEAQILSTVKSFLTSELQLPEEKALPVISQAQQLLGVQLMQSGSNQSPNGDKKSSAEQGAKTSVNGDLPRGPTYITNVPEFKARLAVSAGPSPVVDLTEFEDFEPKL